MSLLSPRSLTAAGVVVLTASLLSPVSSAAQATGTVTGAVTDAVTSEPLPLAPGTQVLVSVYNTSGLLAAETTVTAGHYSVSLEAGTYFLKAWGNFDYVSELHAGAVCIAIACRVTSGTPVTVTSGGTTTIDFALDPAGRISGALLGVDAVASAPVITVEAYDASGSHVRSVNVQETAGAAYTVPGLAAGVYYLLAQPTSLYLNELYDNARCAQFSHSAAQPPCAITLGTPVAVAAGGVTSGVDITLDRAATLSGVVKDESGAPVSGVTVSVSTLTSDVASAISGTDGAYTVRGLATGSYRARTHTAGTGSTLVDEWAGGLCVGCAGSPSPVVMTAGSTTTVDFSLSANGGAIAGTLACCGGIVEVYDSAGRLVKSKDAGIGSGTQPVAYSVDGLAPGSYYVRAYDPPQATIAKPVPTRGDGGDYLHGGVWCGAEDCDVRRGNPVVVRQEEVTSGIDIPLRPGGAIQVVNVSTYARVLEVYDARGVRLRGRVRIAASPPYEVVGLPTGSYFLRTVPRFEALVTDPEPPQLYSGRVCADCPVTSGTPLFVTAGAVLSNVSFAEASGHSVRGTVRDAGDTSPLSSITVELVTRDGSVAAADTTDFTGAFRVRGLAPGTYFLRTTNTRGYVDEVYDNVTCGACDPARGTPIVVAAADVSGLDLSLTRGTMVTGVVKDAVSFFSGAGVSLFSSDGLPAAQARTTVLGEYLAAVPSGTVFARNEPVGGYRQELYDNVACPGGTCDVSTGTPVTATGAVVSNIDFALDACTTMAVAPLRLANAAVGTAYRQTFTVSGGTPPIVFAVADGTLPPGLVLEPASGVLAGTPSEAGRYTFTVSAADAGGCVTTREYTLDVPACAFALVGGDAVSLAAAGAPWLINLANTCGTWTATSDQAWLQASVVGSTAVMVIAQPNTSAAARTAIVTIGPRIFTVNQSGVPGQVPFGVVDIPVDGATASGSLPVSGWALDDVGVSRVVVYRDPVAGEPAGQVYIGDATFVEGARPDVEAAYPTMPLNRRAGWGYLLLTNMLPNAGNGTFRLHVYAQDSWEGSYVLLGSRTIQVDNASSTLPFGAIDTPAQGGFASGPSYINWGWALTPQPAAIPANGSTIQVYIDGVPIGPLDEYNLFRSDVSSLFPGLANSGGPVGYRRFDTTTLEEGIHTIAWVVTDDAARGAGIGSRYFHVRNSAWPIATIVLSGVSAEALALPARVPGIDTERRGASLASLPADTGVMLRWQDSTGAWLPAEAGTDGARTITIDELERIELDLAASVSESCRPTYAGYHLANGELRDLPVGARLDPVGTFYWQPAAGFLGDYPLRFVRTGCAGDRRVLSVTVRIGGES